MLVETKDSELLTAILKHPDVFDWCCEDGIDYDSYTYQLPDGAIALLCMDGDQLDGTFILYPTYSKVLELHTALLPSGRGKKAKAYGREMIQWVWDHTDSNRICTSIASYNRGATIMASLCGMTRYGENPESWLKHGTFHTILLYGTTRGA